MTWYERAEAMRPPGNDDAILRWNACARLIMRDQHLVPAVEERSEPLLLERLACAPPESLHHGRCCPFVAKILGVGLFKPETRFSALRKRFSTRTGGADQYR
jgi:hypothetical protein